MIEQSSPILFILIPQIPVAILALWLFWKWHLGYFISSSNHGFELGDVVRFSFQEGDFKVVKITPNDFKVRKV